MIWSEALIVERAVFENGWDTLFVDFDCDEWARSPFSVGLILIDDHDVAAIQDVLKVFLESKLKIESNS